jgi:hypothetical protein
MTTPDIAGLCERLRVTRAAWSEAKEANIKRNRNPDGPEAAAALERQAAEIERLRGALRNIQIEAEREDGRWVHLKRVIANNARAALTGEDHD